MGIQTQSFVDHLTISSRLFHKALDGLSLEELHRRPNFNASPMIWVAGHVTVYRSRMLNVTGELFESPWLPLFSRGSEIRPVSDYPGIDEVTRLWDELSSRLLEILPQLSVETLEKETSIRTPAPDRSVRGVLAFLGYHEAYHIGQMGLLRRILGYPGIIG